MVDYYHVIALDATTRLDWFPLRNRNYTIAPDGDILVSPFATMGYRIHGVLSLAGGEAETFARANEVAEYYEQPDAFYLWSYEPQGLKLVYCRTDNYGSFWAVPDRPFVSKFVGTNEAVIDVYMRLIGTIADYQACFLVEDVDIETSDWGI